MECRAILERLREEVGFGGSYNAVWRFVRSLEPVIPVGYVRIETAPGDEAQVDFGTAGRLVDPREGVAKKSWLFVMTLGWSRHQYLEFVFDQEVRRGSGVIAGPLSISAGSPAASWWTI